jgi:hypothetical protein
MSINPFATVADYATMLNKIAWYTTVVAGLLVFWLTTQIPQLNAAFEVSALTVEIDGLSVKLSIAVAALIVGFASRVAKLHDRLSDLYGVRRRFDVCEILLPLALSVGAKLDSAGQKRLRKKRSELMSKVFYKYASSGSTKVIDTHGITMALDQWSWYWIALEAQFLTGIAGLICVTYSKFGAACLAWSVAAAISVFLLWSRARSAGYALDEIREIVDDPNRAAGIRQEFNAI